MIPVFFLLLYQSQDTIYRIDGGEAEFYRLFADIDSFLSAKFVCVEDSIQIVFSYIAKGDTVDSLVNISKSVFEGLQFYQKNFHRIITDLKFRKDFLEKYETGWPVISMKRSGKIKNKELSKSIFNSVCCITGTGATGAYIGALAGRSIQRETGYIPCGYQEYSCMIPYEYYSFTIDHTKYYTGMAIGIAGGAIASREFYFKNHKRRALLSALTHDIVTFDENGVPITFEEIERENKGRYTLGIGTLGIVLGGAVTLVGMYALSIPWIDLVPKTDWDDKAVSVPILLISGVSFWHLTMFAFRKGEELDRIATIERIKNKRKVDAIERKGRD